MAESQLIATNLIPAVATIIGAIVSFTGSYYAQKQIAKNRREQRATSLRGQLLAEVERGGTERYTQLPRGSMWQIPWEGMVPRTIYESSAGSLGILKNSETHAVADYYSLAETRAAYFQGLDDTRKETLRNFGQEIERVLDQIDRRGVAPTLEQQYPDSLDLLRRIRADSATRNAPPRRWNVDSVIETTSDEGWRDILDRFAYVQYGLAKLDKELSDRLEELDNSKQKAASALNASSDTKSTEWDRSRAIAIMIGLTGMAVAAWYAESLPALLMGMSYGGVFAIIWGVGREVEQNKSKTNNQ